MKMLPKLLGDEFYLICAGMTIVSVWQPAFGITLFVASIPIVSYLFQIPVLNASVVELSALSVVLGASIHLLWGRREDDTPGPRFHPVESLIPLLLALGILGTYLFAGISRFAPLFRSYPRLLRDNLFLADQLNPFFFVQKTGLWVTAVCLYSLVRWKSKEGRTRRLVYYGLLAQGVVFAVIFFVDLHRYGKPFPGHMLNASWHNAPGLFAIFSEHNTFAVFWLIQTSLLMGVLTTRHGLSRMLAVGALALYSSLVILSLSLSAIFAYCIIVLLGCFLLFKKEFLKRFHLTSRHVSRAVILTTLVLGAVILGALLLRYSPINMSEAVQRRIAMIAPGKFVQSLYQHRMYPWFIAGGMIQDSPVFGIGLGRLYLMYDQYRQKANLSTTDWFWNRYQHENAHNYFIQIAAETGLVGLSLIVAFLVGLFRRCDWHNSISCGAAIAVIGLSVDSLTQHTLLVESIFLTFAIVCALVPTGSVGSSDRWRQIVRSRIFLAGMTMLVILYVTHLVHIWGEMPERFEYGIYEVEKDGEKEFRWFSDLVLIRRHWEIAPGQTTSGDDSKHVEREFSFKAHNPDIETNPLIVMIEQGNRVLTRFALTDHEWHPRTVHFDATAVLILRCSRALEPPGEFRRLGVAVSGLPAD
ncbi:MAG: O-antigen ligase family protein [Acidobacteria bacterium]|nr:O-antigen ligase family protein [Acidobacteriota bacterium]